MIKSYLHAQKRFFACSFFLLIGVHSSNQICIANPSEFNFTETHQAPPAPPLISLEKNVLLVGIKPYLGKGTINDNISPALKLLFFDKST